MTLKVFYDARQSTDKNLSFSPSAGKPALVVEEWKKRGFDFALADVTPVTRDDFYRVHHKGHVDAVLDLKRPNGFNNKIPEVAAALHWTSGSLVSAVMHAMENKVNTCSPTSGFHHAEFYRCEGFCTFNGLMVAAVKLRDKFPTVKVGILDIDHHYGNGTDHIIKHEKLDYVHHYTFGGACPDNYYWKGGDKAEEWVGLLPSIVDGFRGCDIVIYQAGADPHVDDPYGGALTNSQLRDRDRIVFTMLRDMKIPVTWNLAGGYQSPIQKVLDIHNATMEECLKVMV